MMDYEIAAIAARLAEKHRIPHSDVVHPKVFVPDGKGGIDEWMTAKLRSQDEGEGPYVPYCLVGADCGRVRRKTWGFQCPTCGNKMNWDLSHYDGNVNVKFDGPPPVLSIKDWNAQVEARKAAKKARREA
jgi:hypothetical protein